MSLGISITARLIRAVPGAPINEPPEPPLSIDKQAFSNRADLYLGLCGSVGLYECPRIVGVTTFRNDWIYLQHCSIYRATTLCALILNCVNFAMILRFYACNVA